MKPVSLLLLAAALCQTLPAAATTQSTDPAARAQIDRARAEMAAGKAEAAIDTLLEVIKTDTHSSEAPTQLAVLFYNLALSDDSHRAVYFRRQAETFAEKALRIDDEDSKAVEVRDRASGKLEQRLHTVTYAARRQNDAGDSLFDKREWRAAIAKYEEAAKIDPLTAYVHVNIGLCHAQLGDQASAERAYRKATTADPNVEDGWQALYELLHKMERHDAAQAAILGAVTARPNSRRAWFNLLAGDARKGAKPRFFVYKPKGSYSFKNKRMVIDSGQTRVNEAAWTAVAEAQKSVTESDSKLGSAAIQIAAWDKALRTIAETDKTMPVTDPTLRDMLAFHQAGQLKAAVFGLLFIEAWRDEYEAWKKAEPDGLKRFVDAFHIGR